MSEFKTLSEKVRLAEHNAYGDKVIPLEDVKGFIARLRTRLNEVEFSTIDEIRSSQINYIIKRLAGDKLI